MSTENKEIEGVTSPQVEEEAAVTSQQPEAEATVTSQQAEVTVTSQTSEATVTSPPEVTPSAATNGTEPNDVRRSRVGFSYNAEDLPPLKPLKFTHISPAVAGPIHRSKNYADTLVCDQKIAMEQFRHIRRNLEREDRELRRLQIELEQYRTPRKWSSTYY